MQYRNEEKSIYKEEFSGKFDGGNLSVRYLREKCEKISAVLYLLSSKIPDHEPLKARLREKSLALALSSRPDLAVSEVLMHLSDEGGPSRHSFSARFRAGAADLVTLLHISVYGGYVSKMNAEVLVEEIATLASFVRKTDEEDLVSNEENISSFFASDSPESLSSDKGHTTPVEKDINHSRPNTPKTSGTGAELRKRLILGIIKERGVVSIKDISAKIKDVSEKTIQRELVALGEAGTIVREGSRRWSVYKLSEAPTGTAAEVGEEIEAQRQQEVS